MSHPAIADLAPHSTLRSLPATGQPRVVARKGFRSNIATQVDQHRSALQERRAALTDEINEIDGELADLAPIAKHLEKFLVKEGA